MKDVKATLAGDIKTAKESLKPENQRTYPVGTSALDAALSKLAAETLRADTAEADLRTERLRADAAVGDANDAERELAAAEQRIAELTKSFDKFRDVVRGCERLASQYSPCIDAVDEGGGDDNEDPTLAIFHRLYYAMFDADAALNPKPEAGSHENYTTDL